MLLAVDVGNTNTVLGLYRLDVVASLRGMQPSLPVKGRTLRRIGALVLIARKRSMSTVSFS